MSNNENEPIEDDILCGIAGCMREAYTLKPRRCPQHQGWCFYCEKPLNVKGRNDCGKCRVELDNIKSKSLTKINDVAKGADEYVGGVVAQSKPSSSFSIDQPVQKIIDALCKISGC